ncbi:MAG: hypothetical protein OXS50_00540 [Gammaproteobacteria bacterium]|nr:hypothetical protein [Gammaproteobacteria bacterium]
MAFCERVRADIVHYSDLHFHVDAPHGNGRWPEQGVIADLLGDLHPDIPMAPGVYVLGTSAQALVYPWGTSKVFYIGESADVRRRLQYHRRQTLKVMEGEIRSDHERNQFGAAFGMECAWWTCAEGETSRGLEDRFLRDFWARYGATPVANGQWTRGESAKADGDGA